MSLRQILRALYRGVGLLGILISGGLEYRWHSWRRPTQNLKEWQGIWLQALVWRILSWMKVRIHRSGKVPERGWIVSNHLGYLDILVLASVQPLAFLSKKEVDQWPLIGWLTRCAGTVYVDRERPMDSVDLVQEIAGQCRTGHVFAFFPEGTSTDGSSVLRFRSSLFQAAVDHHLPVTPASLRYDLPGGDPRTVVCYWGGMTFVSHLFRLLGEKNVNAYIQYGEELRGYSCRKVLARAAGSSVRQLLQGAGRRAPPAPTDRRVMTEAVPPFVGSASD